jgi:hypothetical protein
MGAVAIQNVRGSVVALGLFLALLLLFAAAGGGLIVLGLRFRSEGRKRGEREIRYPDQPWRWREDWEQNFARAFGGRARFHLATNPGVLGGKLKGHVEPDAPLPPGTPLDVTLECASWRPTGRGGQPASVLWQESAQTAADGSGGVPVNFDIPFDARATGSGRAGESIDWRLRVQCPSQDVHFTFEVPVFQTAASDSGLTAESMETRAGKRLPAPDPGRIERIPTRGGVRYKFPAGRQRSAAIMVILFGLIFVGLALFFTSQHVTGWLAIPVTGVFGWVLVVIGIWLLFGVTTITSEGRELRIRASCLGLSSTRTVRADEIAHFEIKVGLQKGVSRVWYNVDLRLVDGAVRNAGTGMEKSEAEWFVAELKRNLRLS